MEAMQNETPISSKDMLLLSELYRKGEGSTKDLDKSRKWLMKAIEANDCTAIEVAAMDYMNGNELFEKDIQKGLELFEKAAELGSSDAQVFYGLSHLMEIGRPFEPMIGLFWIKKAAERGNPDADDILKTFFRQDGREVLKYHYKRFINKEEKKEKE